MVVSGAIGLGLRYCSVRLRLAPACKLAAVVGALLGGPAGCDAGGCLGCGIGRMSTDMPVYQALLGMAIGLPCGAVVGGFGAMGLVVLWRRSCPL